MIYDLKPHDRKSIRLKEFDYSQNGYYFITICTKNRECWFGKIQNGKIILSEIGLIVKQYWQRNYYEHVIRNKHELNRIREYIINNPFKWELDKYNPSINTGIKMTYDNI